MSDPEASAQVESVALFLREYPEEAINVLSLYTEDIRHQIQQALVTLREEESRTSEWLRALLGKSEDERTAEAARLFDAILLQGTDAFLRLIRSLARQNTVALVMESTRHIPEEDRCLLPLRIDHTLYVEAIGAFQRYQTEHPEEGAAFLQGIAAHRKPEVDISKRKISMRKAGIPEMDPIVERYENRMVAYDTDGTAAPNKNLYSWLKLGFQKIGRELFGEGTETFYTKGVTLSFERILDRLRGRTGIRTHLLVGTPGEYIPMYADGGNDVHHVPLPHPDVSDEELLFAIEEQIRSLVDGSDTPTDVVVLLSASLRIGGRTIDTATAVTRVQALNAEYRERTGRTPVHLCIDASQSSEIITGADIVLYGKRVSSGAAMAVMNATRYQKKRDGDGNVTEDIQEAVRIRYGFENAKIAQMIAALHCLQTKAGHSPEDLLRVPDLWKSQFRGTYIAGQIKEGQEAFSRSTILSSHFRFVVPEQGEGWKHDILMRLEPLRDSIDMRAVVAALQERNVFVQTFQLEPHETYPRYPHLQEIRANLDSWELPQLLRKLREYQDFYKDHICWSLIPADTSDVTQVRFYVRRAIEQHSSMRLFMSVEDFPGYLPEFFRRLEEVMMQLSSSPSPLPS